MNDKIFEAFLKQQFEEGMALAEDSELLQLVPLDGPVPQHYVAEFHCTGLVLLSNGEVQQANRFQTGIFFPTDYLRRAEPEKVLTWLGPSNIFHPNIRAWGQVEIGVICLGRLAPGTPLVELCYRISEIISYQRVTMREDDAVNPAACVWARQNQSRFPLDRRPLKRRQVGLDVEKVV